MHEMPDDTGRHQPDSASNPARRWGLD